MLHLVFLDPSVAQINQTRAAMAKAGDEKRLMFTPDKFAKYRIIVSFGESEVPSCPEPLDAAEASRYLIITDRDEKAICRAISTKAKTVVITITFELWRMLEIVKYIPAPPPYEAPESAILPTPIATIRSLLESSPIPKPTPTPKPTSSPTLTSTPTTLIGDHYQAFDMLEKQFAAGLHGPPTTITVVNQHTRTLRGGQSHLLVDLVAFTPTERVYLTGIMAAVQKNNGSDALFLHEFSFWFQCAAQGI